VPHSKNTLKQGHENTVFFNYVIKGSQNPECSSFCLIPKNREFRPTKKVTLDVDFVGMKLGSSPCKKKKKNRLTSVWKQSYKENICIYKRRSNRRMGIGKQETTY
jgi:hypothetical protein